ncbi:glutamate--cysteine ligase [Embleya sp. NPDC008237]|uniref:carboxylate-amine ligase n=1 Tax=Embleya sp. NPDC008237 TaxID=3363978 RepID=UPI0036E79456
MSPSAIDSHIAHRSAPQCVRARARGDERDASPLFVTVRDRGPEPGALSARLPGPNGTWHRGHGVAVLSNGLVGQWVSGTSDRRHGLARAVGAGCRTEFEQSRSTGMDPAPPSDAPRTTTDAIHISGGHMSIRTVGVEEEFHIVDRRTGRLTPAGTELLAELPAVGFTGEAKEASIETNSEPHLELADLRADLIRSRTLLAEAAEKIGVAVIASGTAPSMELTDSPQAAGERYAAIKRDYALVADEQVVCGLHVHVGVEDRDVAARAMSWISPHLPTLLALSASSPYWLGVDTGYASWRNMLWQRWPSAGPADDFASAREYDDMLEGMVRSGVILDLGMHYQDLRLSSHVPTIEMRICDACPDVDTSVLIALLFRALVQRGVRAAENGEQPRRHSQAWLRAATWRAARSGLEGLLIDPTTMATDSARVVVWQLIEELMPDLVASGDLAFVRTVARRLLEEGSSAARQLRLKDPSPRAAVELLRAQTLTFPDFPGAFPKPQGSATPNPTTAVPTRTADSSTLVA